MSMQRLGRHPFSEQQPLMKKYQQEKAPKKINTKNHQSHPETQTPLETHWRIFLGQKEYHDHHLGDQFPLSSRLAVKMGGGSTKLAPPFSESKREEAQSLSNYISYQRLSPRANLLLMVRLMGPNPQSLTPALLQLTSEHQDVYIDQYLKTSRTKLKICFSSQWRELQPLVYLLICEVKQQQPSFYRVHILSRRGLILQTVTNLKEKFLEDQISKIVKQHYRRLKTLVVVSQKGSEVSGAAFQKFNLHFEHINLMMVNFKSRDSLHWAGQGQYIKTYANPCIPNTYISMHSNQQVLICSNFKLTRKSITILHKLHGILSREAQIAPLHSFHNYESAAFNRKQSLLRLFAYQYNFTTLNGMEVQSKDNLQLTLLQSEFNSLTYRESKQKEAENLIVHLYTRHPTPLICIVCQRRTKMKCEKCYMQFNRNFGICQKRCFEKFHHNIEHYTPEVFKKKRVIFEEIPNKQEQNMEEWQVGSSQGRKRVKEYSEVDYSSSLQPSLQQLMEKWGQEVLDEQCELQQLRKNYELGLLSEKVMQKAKYASKRITQLQDILRIKQCPK